MEKERRKVNFWLTTFTKRGAFRFFGHGEIDDENLYTDERVYEDCIRFCHPTVNSARKYKGSFSEFETRKFENEKHQIVELEVETCYQLWFEILD